MSLGSLYEAALRSKVLNHHNAPGLVRCIEEMSAKAGTKISKIRLLPTSIPNAAFFMAEGSLWITEGLCELLESSNLQKHPSEELQAIIAHELGHAKHRVGHFGPMIGITASASLVRLVAFHLVTRTFDRIRDHKKENPDHPETFWQAFSETTKEMREKGLWWSFKESVKSNYPVATKIISSDPRYKNKSWGRAVLQSAEASITSLALAMPAYAACRPFALRNERQADRFAVALMGEGESFAKAMEKLHGHMKEKLDLLAKSPLQKSWALKIANLPNRFLGYTVAAHPPTMDRVSFARGANIADLRREFHL